MVEDIATTLTIADAAKAAGLSAMRFEWKINYYREQLERQ